MHDHPHKEFVHFVVSGFEEGFEVGLDRHANPRPLCHNPRAACHNLKKPR